MKECLRSSVTVTKSDNDVVQEGNNVDLGLDKGDLIFSDGNNEKNGLSSGVMVSKPENGEVLRESNFNLGTYNVDGDIADPDKKNDMELVPNEVDCTKDSLVVLSERKAEDGKDDDANGDTNVVTNEPKIRRGRLPKKRRRGNSDAKGKVIVIADPYMVSTALKRKRGRPPKERREGEGTVNADPDRDTTAPKKKRGRPPKIRRAAIAVKEKVRVNGLEKIGDMNNASVKEKDGQASVDVDPEFVVETLTSPSERKMEGKRNGSDESEHMECKEQVDGGHSDKHNGRHKIEKAKRGRKRKTVESSMRKLDNGVEKKKAKETPFGDKNAEVGRTLRSRAVVMIRSEKQESDGLTGDVVNGKWKKKNDASGKKIVEKIKEESAQLTGRRKKKIKGRQGRPPKVGKGGPVKMIVSEKQKKIGFRKTGDPPTSKKVIMGSKLVDTAKPQKVVSSSSHGADKKIVLKQLNMKKQKEGEERGLRTQKQLLKERIMAMLESAGWTIEFRPRNGREYNDAVYVSPQGKGYWSCTLAYKILKQEVEGGVADSRAVSAFTPIPEDEWSKLLRISRKKNGIEGSPKEHKGDTDKASKGVSRKKIPKRKHAEEKGHLRHKQKESVKRSNGKDRKNRKRCTLLARDSMKGLDPDSEDSFLYEGKRSLLSWMIDLGTVPLSGKVQCMNHKRTQVLLEGRVTKDGIHCDCCNEILSVSDFETHSGNTLSQPFQNIFLNSGSSLLQCLRDSWSKYEKSVSFGFHPVEINGDDPNDDTCNMCGDGGDLICCDSCPSAFHQNCLDIQKFPSGDWNCVYCSCKFCGMVGASTLERDQNCDTSGPALPTCRLCEEKYHQLCVQGNDTSHVEPNSLTFCGQKCREIFQQLEMLLGVKHQMEEGFSWTLIQHSADNTDISTISGTQRVECNSKLAVAWSVMDECFLPIVDQRSGINMIRNVVYSCGSNIRRLSYTGFFTVILERGDEIVAAASLRIHGNLLAEMPFIGTRHIYRRQGMCRRLLSAIEAALCSLNVEKLVIPAISELQQTWTSVFGFMPFEELHKKEMKCMNMIVFPGVDMLQKPIVNPQIGGENQSSASAIKSSENKTTEYQTTHHRESNSDMGCSPELDSNISHEVISDHACGAIDLAAKGDSIVQLPNVSSNRASDMTSELVNFQESVTIDNKSREAEAINDPEAPAEDTLQLDALQLSGGENLWEAEAINDPEAPAEDTLQLDALQLSGGENLSSVSGTSQLDEINKEENVHLGHCNITHSGNSKLNEQSNMEVEDKLSAVSEIVSDPITCERKIPHISDGKEIANELNGEVNAVNHSREQRVLNDCGTSTQPLVLV